MPITNDLKHHKFGQLTAIEIVGRSKSRRVLWKCLCECGSVSVVESSNLISGNSTSCGCKALRVSSANPLFVHGRKSGDPTYGSWSAMRARCMNPRNPKYPNYGGRGIVICSRWNTFQFFLEDMGERPAGKTIDRIDVNGDYAPENCRWATAKEQRNNQRHKGTKNG